MTDPGLLCFEIKDGLIRLTSQLSIRDYFAAMSIAPTIASFSDITAEQVAARAYHLADAMLKERDDHVKPI